jgi:hypothetical protein
MDKSRVMAAFGMKIAEWESALEEVVRKIAL